MAYSDSSPSSGNMLRVHCNKQFLRKRPLRGCWTPRHISTRSFKMSLRDWGKERTYTTPTVISKQLQKKKSKAKKVNLIRHPYSLIYCRGQARCDLYDPLFSIHYYSETKKTYLLHSLYCYNQLYVFSLKHFL